MGAKVRPKNFVGKKGRSGRRPKAITLLRRQLALDGKADAEYAYSLFVSIMKDDSADMGLRKECAKEVMDRVLGKPTQVMGQDASMPFDLTTLTVFVHKDE